MSRPATTRLKVNPPLGQLPALQYLLPAQLKIDDAYQRSLETGPSQTLVRRIAMFWNWDLCQPLVVARRDDGALYVIDGQHRLEAARLRGDIAQLPAVVVQYASAADEAASFVHLNQQRRPLSKLDVFKAAVASGDSEATAIKAALTAEGLSIAAHSNVDYWKPGELANIGGIERAWRINQPAAASAIRALAEAFQGQKLRYAGTIFPGIFAVCAHERPTPEQWSQFVQMLRSKSQAEQRNYILEYRAKNITLNMREAAERGFRVAWRKLVSSPQPTPTPASKPAQSYQPPARAAPATPDGKRWCDQCEGRVHLSAAALCKSRHCKLRPALVAS